ncbi:uncharacterized protein LOC131225653 [Magnolia sinica]|uniref:uncharacterized protein LOC131225653 n=1 Tax=Magnolia sinica TaxID=86752 RepID=UPI00265A2282|nr:uncharacterized protein LOC131225653 [Magnolia sinica]
MVAQAQDAPYGVLLAVVVGLMVAGPILLSDPAEIISEAVSGLLGPAGLLLLPVALLLFIQFLSSGRGTALSQIFYTGEPDSIHRVGGFPVGVALFLLVLLFLLYSRVSLFGSGDDDSGE